MPHKSFPHSDRNFLFFLVQDYFFLQQELFSYKRKKSLRQEKNSNGEKNNKKTLYQENIFLA